MERFKAPPVTYADGLIQVYADCAEDLRSEYQLSVARFAANEVETLYRGLNKKPQRFSHAGILIHIGDCRTNDQSVVTRVRTNEQAIVTRIYLSSPEYADLDQFRMAVSRGFFRSVEGREATEDEILKVRHRTDPRARARDERARLEDWLNGRSKIDDEEGLRLLHRVFEPGIARPRDLLTFASHLFLYPPYYDYRFLDRFDKLSFREAVKFGRMDPLVRIVAFCKAGDLPVLGLGRGEGLAKTAELYRTFLLALASGERTEDELLDLLEAADLSLNLLYERAMRNEKDDYR